ncbi:hypothetical protein [Alkalimonas amylolytica]|uniref:Uncharacterized protein n=1 Tax=Alkalimonas amylolytica TaxID=152573 RepID=A0A1H4DHG8_ALKAM|nr:hypothetical protein [Alkalimonas amylolytica]SEA72211.1 hypothetical protein SAMN04488051_105258 [Alkalimonas amylolytica]
MAKTADKNIYANVFLRQLNALLTVMYQANQPHDSLFGQMRTYFQQEQHAWQELKSLQQRWQDAKAQQDPALSQHRRRYTELSYQLEQQRIKRLEQSVYCCELLLQLSEGESKAETLTRSARLLGSLQLLVPHQPKRALEVQFSYKLLYKMVLALRLLDHRLERDLMPSSWQLCWQQRQSDPTASTLCPFRNQIQLPLLQAILVQEFGQLHPAAQKLLLNAERRLDPLTELDGDARYQFLLQSHQGSLQLVQQGLGVWPYQGSDKTERQQHEHQQQKQQQWIKQLLEATQVPGQGSGNLLKVPQVYASIVMPGRKRFRYEALPKAALLLKQGVQQQLYSADWVDQLLRITGLFPQGYGLAFIPARASEQSRDKYEFAIVNALYPAEPQVPHCRIVTRNLQYKNTGKDYAVPTAQNLYFRPARKQLEVVPPERLREILTKLFADAEQRFLRQLLPRCWQPSDFFSLPAHQNLWNKG